MERGAKKEPTDFQADGPGADIPTAPRENLWRPTDDVHRAHGPDRRKICEENTTGIIQDVIQRLQTRSGRGTGTFRRKTRGSVRAGFPARPEIENDANQGPNDERAAGQETERFVPHRLEEPSQEASTEPRTKNLPRSSEAGHQEAHDREGDRIPHRRSATTGELGIEEKRLRLLLPKRP